MIEIIVFILQFTKKLLIEEEFEDTKGVIRICILKDRQRNG
jgi:hypothetical protein